MRRGRLCVVARFLTLFSVFETREGQFACRLTALLLCPIASDCLFRGRRTGTKRKAVTIGHNTGCVRRSMTDDTWGLLRKRLLKTVGQNNFTTWIEPLELDQVDGGVATFHVPTNFMGNYVSQNFADLILHEFNLSGEPVQRLAFKVAANSPTRPVQPTVSEAIEAPMTSAQPHGSRAACRAGRHGLRQVPAGRTASGSAGFCGLPLTALLSESRTSWPMPPRGGWPRAVP